MQFTEITNFNGIDGWTEDRVVISNGPEPRTARLLYRTFVSEGLDYFR